MTDSVEMVHSPDLSVIQDIRAMQQLPHAEYLDAARGMRVAMEGRKGHDVKAVDIGGRLNILRRVGSWWYCPHAERGWRCPDKI